MKLHKDWKKILFHSHAIKLATVVTVLNVLEAILPAFEGLPYVKGISAVVSASVIVARLIYQDKLHD